MAEYPQINDNTLLQDSSHALGEKRMRIKNGNPIAAQNDAPTATKQAITREVSSIIVVRIDA